MASVKIIGKVAVKVMPDTSDFKDRLKADLDKIERQIGDLTVDVVPQITKAAKEKVEKELDLLTEKMSGKNINFDLDLNDDDVAGVEAALDALARNRKADIKVDYDKNSLDEVAKKLLMLGGARPQIDALHESLDQLGNLDYVALSVAKTLVKFTLLGGAALATSGEVLSVAGALAKIGPASLALPGILGGMAVGLGVTAAAFKDFNKYVPQASGYMKELQATISSNFWAQAAGQINAFVNGVFPILQRNLSTTSTELGKFFGSLAGALGTSLNPALSGMFDDLNKSITIATEHVGSIANIIRDLGTVGAANLPRLAAAFGNIIDRFSAFLTKAANDGSLTRWVNTGINNLLSLGKVIGDIGGIFYGLYKAASDAGGAGLGDLHRGLSNISDTVNSPGFQKGMTAAFKSAYDMMNAITTGAGPGLKSLIISIGDTFSKVGPGLGKSIGDALGTLFTALSDPSIGAGLVTVFDSINTALSTMQTTITPLVGLLASLAPVIAAMLTAVANIGASGSARLAVTLEGVAAALAPLITQLGVFLTTVTNALIPVFAEVGTEVVKLIGKMGPLLTAISDLWTLLSPVLVPVLKFLVSIIGDSLIGVIVGLTMVFKGITKVIEGVVSVFKGIWDVISGLFTLDFSKVGKGFSEIFGGLKDIVLGALEAVAGAIWAWMNGSVVGIFRKGLIKLAGPFAKFLDPLLKVLDDFVGFIGGWVSKALGPVKEFAGTAFDYIINGGKKGESVLAGIWGRITEVLTYPFKALKDFVQPVFDVIAKVIKTYITIWKTIFETEFKIIEVVFKTAWAVIKTVFEGALKGITVVAKTVWTGVVEFFQTTLNALYGIFEVPWNAIADFLTGLWTTVKAGAMLIWDALSAYFEGFLTKEVARFEGAWQSISSAISAVWDAIKGYFSTVFSGIKAIFDFYVNAIITVLDTTWAAIKATVETVWDAISGKVSAVWDAISKTVDTAVKAVRDTLGAIWDAIKTKVTNVWSTIESDITSAWDTIKTTVNNAVGLIKQHISDAWDSVRNTVVSAWNSIKQTVTDKITDVVSEVGKLPGKASDALVGIATVLVQKGEALIGGVISGIGNKWDDLKTTVGSLGTKAVDAVGDLGNTLVKAGEALIGGFIQGILNKFNDVKGTLGSLTDKLKDWKGPAPLDRVLLTPAGQMVIDGFIKGLESRYQDVRTSLQGLTSDIASQFDNGSTYRIGIATELDTSSAGALSAIRGLDAKVTTSAAVATDSDKGSSIHIDNITIPLDDLKQLNTLEEFMDMLRVRTRKGVAA